MFICQLVSLSLSLSLSLTHTHVTHGVSRNRSIFIIIIIIIIIIIHLWVFPTSVSWWSSQVSRILLSILAVLNNAVVWKSPLVLLFLNPPVPLPILWWLYQGHWLLLVSPSLSCSIVFFSVPYQGQGTYLSFCFLSVLLCGLPRRQSPQFDRFSLGFLFLGMGEKGLLIITRSGRLVEIKWFICISKSQRNLCVSFSRTDCAYSICLDGQILISCTVPSGSPSPPSRSYNDDNNNNYYYYDFIWRCLWCNGYRHRKWTRQLEFKSWTRMIAFHIALILLGKVWIQ